MQKKKPPAVGSVKWFDLTVRDASKLRDFYAKVVGWESDAIDVGGYSDFAMRAPRSRKPVAGICHKRGPNRGVPSQWLIYITVADLKRSIATAKKLGGSVLHGPRKMGAYGSFAIIKDPAGAVAGLIQPPPA